MSTARSALSSGPSTTGIRGSTVSSAGALAPAFSNEEHSRSGFDVIVLDFSELLRFLLRVLAGRDRAGTDSDYAV